MSLLGARILVTRPRGGWEALERRVAEAGGVVEFRAPTLPTPPSDPEGARRAASGIADFAWVVLTSRRGVAALAEALAAAGARPPGSLRAACVGPATAHAAREHGFEAVLVSPEGSGAALARDLGARLGAGERVLVVRPESDSAFPIAPLESVGARIDSVAFYRTAVSPEAAAIAADLARGHYAAAVVTAPSALAALSVAALSNAKRVALGSTTAAALERAGVPAHAIAAAPTPDAVADALESL